MELCLGTVQFGMDYGILGKKKPKRKEAIKCLEYAINNGITAFDTAKAYGDAEEVLGEFIRKNTHRRDKIFISTKLLPNVLDNVKEEEYFIVIKEHIQKQLETLNTDYVDAYYLHTSRYAFDEQILDALIKIKDRGYTRKVGVSVYEQDEALACMKYPGMDIIQLPYSIFDHRMKKSKVFDFGKEVGFDIHCRSAFIQGLIMLNENNVPSFLEEAVPILKKVETLCKENNISRIELAISYIKREKAVSHLVFGVDNIEELKEDIEGFNKDIDEDLLKQIEMEFESIKAEIVMPSLWKK